MATGKVEIDVPATPDTVWAVVGDFAGIDAWFPGIDGVRMEGDDRVVKAGESEVRERLLANDDAARTQRYSVTDGFPGLERHEATLAVEPGGAGSHVVWSFDVAPDDRVAVMTTVYTRALEALRAHFS